MTRYRTTAALIALLAFFVTAEARAQPESPRWHDGAGGLTFVADISDFSLINLRCEGRAIVVSVPPPVDSVVDDFIYAGIQLKSDEQAGHYRAMVVHGDSETRFEARTTLQDPVIRAFRRTGRISVRGEPELSAATKSERTLIKHYFEACH